MRSRAGRHDLGSPGTVTVQSGQAELLADVEHAGGWLLLLDRIRQSYVDLDDPTYLDFEYMQSFADVLQALPDGPLAVTHLGGGALAFPRYLSAVRPGSTQIVFEPDAELTRFVVERLPLPRHSGIKVRPHDGRGGLITLRDQSADVVILDAFADGRIPRDLTSLECIGEIYRVLKPQGVLLANLADGWGLDYIRRVVATVRVRLPRVLLISDPAVFKGRRFGNVVLAASLDDLANASITRACARAPFPRGVLGPEETASLSFGAKVLTDADPMLSPEPPMEGWRVQ